jgi:hypothetical protein
MIIKRYRVAFVWLAYCILALCAGFAMTGLGYTIEAGYFWQRQVVVFGILAIPAIKMFRHKK